MSETESNQDRPRKPRRRSAHAEGQGPGDAHDHPPIPFTPKEQGGAAMGHDQPHASGASPAGAAPPGPQPSVEPALEACAAADAGDDSADFDPAERRQLVLVKNGHRYVFRYERGEETKVLSGLVDMAKDPKSELDWFDAAVLSHQLGQRMSEQLDRLRRA